MTDHEQQKNPIKTVLITGASSGIGKALAYEYANMGYRVIAGGRNQARLNELCQHPLIEAFLCDLTSKTAIHEASKSLPDLDLIILNAGNCEYIDDPVEFDSDLFERVINTNLISVGHCLAAWTRLLNPYGQIAFTSSSAQLLPFPRAAAYGASKAALTYLARSLAIDLSPYHIDISVIHPGFVATPLTDKNNFAMPAIVSSEKMAKYIVKGLNKRKHEILYPRIFTWTLKLLALLPFNLWKKIALRTITK